MGKTANRRKNDWCRYMMSGKKRPVARGKKSWAGSTKTLLHAPRFMFILCFMIIGNFMAETVNYQWMLIEIVAVSIAVLMTAYSLDELKGRHCGTCISDRELKVRASVGLSIAVILGLFLIYTVHWSLFLWTIVGLIGIVFYNFEIGGDTMHNVWVFGFTWGCVPVWASFYMQTLTLTPAVIFMGVFAMVVARLHLWSYGHTKCYHSDVCLDVNSKLFDFKCHGMYCGVRLHMPREVHKLAWTLIQSQFWFIVILTAVFVSWRLF